jgi:histidine ammonia-lyase
MQKSKTESKSLTLTGYDLDIDDVWNVANNDVQISLCEKAVVKINESRAYIQGRIDKGDIMYGVNTGFGHFADVAISRDQLVELQKNLIRSHSVGVGAPFEPREVKAIMLLRANALTRGHSGIRPKVVEKILEFINHNITPYIPSQGSVGASGDLAPLAHLALSLIGEGSVWDGVKKTKTSDKLKELGIEPLELQFKEGLSLINGCQVMTAVGLLNCFRARRILQLFDCAGAMTLEALKGTRAAFDPLISATRAHPGEAKTARNMLKLLGATSPIAESHLDCGRVQDAYSLRCIPAVHGAAKDSVGRVIEVLEVEANSSTDNPLVFAKEGKILSCGNFHGEPVAFQLDYLAICLSALASISECRIEKLINPSMSNLPAFLAPEGGLNSGMMIVQVAAASLVSENKILSHPASVDSIPTSADKEDHVSMGTIAARKAKAVLENAEKILAMEFLCATQGLDMLKPLRPAGVILEVLDFIRKGVPFAQKDRVFADDIEAIAQMIADGSLNAAIKLDLEV